MRKKEETEYIIINYPRYIEKILKENCNYYLYLFEENNVCIVLNS